MNLIAKTLVAAMLLLFTPVAYLQKLDTALFNQQLKALIKAEAGEIDGKEISTSADYTTHQSKLPLKGFTVTTVYSGQDFYKEAEYNKKADTMLLMQMVVSIRSLHQYKLWDSERDSAFIRKHYPKVISEKRKIIGLDVYNKARLTLDLYDDGKLRMQID